MNILLVGALSWNPERVLELSANGHRLFGLWSRTMGWEQGPYPFGRGVITDVNTEEAVQLLHERGIDLVYSLFQVYDTHLWAPAPTPGMEDVWTQLCRLIRERDRGARDVPVVKHWGFDVHHLDLGIVRSLDGQIFCNRHKLRYWTAPRRAGGCGLDLGCEKQEVAFMDSDLPSREFMTDRFSPKLSAADGEIHTVCVGRPLGIDFLAAARAGIHVHLYGNNYDDVATTIARELSPLAAARFSGLIADYVHVHPSLQPADLSLEAIRAAKSRWVEKFSRYDAGWSYVGTPLPWTPLEDQAAIPNKLGTYLLAGLPIIAETMPGYHRYDTLAANGVAVDFPSNDYSGLAASLRCADKLAGMNEAARHVRRQFSFEATIDPLLEFLERVRNRRRSGVRKTIAGGSISRPRRVHLSVRPFSVRGVLQEHVHPRGWRTQWESLVQRFRMRGKWLFASAVTRDYLSRALMQPASSHPENESTGSVRTLEGRRPRILVIERFPSASRNCDLAEAVARASEVHVLRLGGDERLLRPSGLRVVRRELARRIALPARCLRSVAGIAADRTLSRNDKRAVVLSALATRGAPAASLAGAHQALRLLRSKHVERVECYSARGFMLAPALCKIFGIPYREFLSRGTRYFGEFAFELLAVVPYAYWLHREGRLEITQACADTRCLYYFSPNHQEVATRRSYVPVSEYPCVGRSESRFDHDGFPEHLDTRRWAPPPYKSIFANQIFRWPKPLCIVSNKYTPEPSVSSGEAVNTIPVPELLAILEMLRERFQVVYVRPRPSDIVSDHQKIGDPGDIAAVCSHFPDVLTIQQIHEDHPELSFNELQMRLFANCERFVSVLGGSSYLSSYFGGKSIILGREGWEVSCNAYSNWFHLFSGAEIFHATTLEQLVELVRREMTP